MEDEERASNTGNAYQPAAADTAGESSGSNLGEKNHSSASCGVGMKSDHIAGV